MKRNVYSWSTPRVWPETQEAQWTEESELRLSRSTDGQAQVSAILPSPPLNLSCAKLAHLWKPAERVSSPTTEGPPGVEAQTALCVPRAHCTTSRPSCDIGLQGAHRPLVTFCRGTAPSPLRLIPDQAPLYGGWFKKKKEEAFFPSGVMCDVQFGAAVRKPAHREDEPVSAVISELRLPGTCSCRYSPRSQGVGLGNLRCEWTSVRLKVRGAAHEHCTPVYKGASQGGQVKLSDAGVCGLQWIRHLNAGQAGEPGISLSEGGVQISQVGRVGWSLCSWIMGSRETSTNSHLTKHRYRHRQQCVQSHGYTRNTKQQRSKIPSAATNCQHSQKNIFQKWLFTSVIILPKTQNPSLVTWETSNKF